MATVVEQLKAFPRCIVLVERRGDSMSNLVAQAIQEHESKIPATYIGIVAQDFPDVLDELAIKETPTVLIFENGKEKCRAGFDELTELVP